jgi:nucleoside-diphosphate-sugar epimerase
MKVLVTGGTGVVGKPTVDVLVARGHTVRLFSRNAERDCERWARGVEPYPGSVGSDEDVRGAADGCDAVLHVAGIVDEVPPEATFDNVNVQGTRRIVEEAERAGVGRLIYVSSLGAERGSSGYHRSKRAGEEITQRFSGNWLVLRPGNVYGAGDQVISLLLKMVRMLPVIPVIGGGDQTFQPVSADDLAEALVRALERTEPARQVLDLSGTERVSINQLLDRVESITDRHPQRLPIPTLIAVAGARLADAVGMEVPINGDQVTMLLEENVIPPGRPNALVEVFGVTPTPLAEGLRRLAQSLPEKLPSDGVGPLHKQTYRGDISGSGMDADALFETIRTQFHTLLPSAMVELGVEPGTPLTVEEGATLTMAVPLRGNVQVRVEEVGPRGMTFVTVEGHHLAGAIRFVVRDLGERLRFEIRSYSRSADLVDSLGMVALGRRLQKETWKSVVEAVVERCGGTAAGAVHEEARDLTPREAERVERWVERMVLRRKRRADDSMMNEE